MLEYPFSFSALNKSTRALCFIGLVVLSLLKPSMRSKMEVHNVSAVIDPTFPAEWKRSEAARHLNSEDIFFAYRSIPGMNRKS